MVKSEDPDVFRDNTICSIALYNLRNLFNKSAIKIRPIIIIGRENASILCIIRLKSSL